MGNRGISIILVFPLALLPFVGHGQQKAIKRMNEQHHQSLGRPAAANVRKGHLLGVVRWCGGCCLARGVRMLVYTFLL